MDKVKITPKYTAREQRLRNRLEETSFQLAQQTELAGGYLLEVFSLKGQLEEAEATIKAADELADEWENDETLGRERDGIICADQLRKLLRSKDNG